MSAPIDDPYQFFATLQPTPQKSTWRRQCGPPERRRKHLWTPRGDVIAAAPTPTRMPGNADRKGALSEVIQHQAIIPAKNVVYNAQLPPGVSMVLDNPRRTGSTAPLMPRDPRVLGMRQEGALQVQPLAPGKWHGSGSAAFAGATIDSRAAHVSVRGGDAPAVPTRSLRGASSTMPLVTSHAPNMRAALASTPRPSTAFAVSRSQMQTLETSHLEHKRHFAPIAPQPPGKFATAHQGPPQKIETSHNHDKPRFSCNPFQLPGKYATAHQGPPQKNESSHNQDKPRFSCNPSQPAGRSAFTHQGPPQKNESSHNQDKRHYSGNPSQPAGRSAFAHQGPLHLGESGHIPSERKPSVGAASVRFSTHTSVIEAQSSHAPTTRNSLQGPLAPGTKGLSGRSGGGSLGAGVTDHATKSRDTALLVPNLMRSRVLSSSGGMPESAVLSARPVTDRELAFADGLMVGAPSTVRRNAGATAMAESARPDTDRLLAGLGAPSAKIGPGLSGGQTSTVPQRETRTGETCVPVARFSAPAPAKNAAHAVAPSVTDRPEAERAPLVMSGSSGRVVGSGASLGAGTRLSTKTTRASKFSIAGFGSRAQVPQRESAPELAPGKSAREGALLPGGTGSAGGVTRRGVRALDLDRDGGRCSRIEDAGLEGPTPQVNILKRSAPLATWNSQDQRGKDGETSSLVLQAKRMRLVTPGAMGSNLHVRS
jgi:hypothetical protein